MTPSPPGPSPGTATLRVLGVGGTDGFFDRLADRDDFAVRTVDDSDGVEERMHEDRVDCVVSVHDDGSGVRAVLRAVGDCDPAVPVIVCAPDPGVAADAFEAGAADFFELRDDPGRVELLAHRVENVVERVRATTNLRATRDALDEFGRITADDGSSFEEKVRRLLDVGRGRTGTGGAYLTSVDRDAGRLEVVEAVGECGIDAGDEYDLSTTYCRRTVDADAPLEVHDAPNQGWADDSARETTGHDCYLGAAVTVDCDTFGTVAFVDGAGRERFRPDEVAVARVVAEWIGNELERWRTQNRLERTLERIDDGFFVVDGEGRFTYVNERSEELLGVDADAILGKRFDEVLPAAASGVYDTLRTALDTCESTSLEWYHESADRWLDTWVYPATDGVSVYLRDISRRKERDRELRRYETIVETAPDGGYILDEDARFVAVNDRLTDLTGYSREEMVGSHASRYLDEDDLGRIGEARDRVRTNPGTAETVEVVIYPRDGGPFPCEVRFSGLHDEDGEFRGTAGIVRDVTVRVERERTLRELQETTRELIRTDSREAAARLAVEAADRVLGLRVNAVWLQDPGESVLSPTAATDAARALVGGSLPSFEPGEGIVGDAFESGEVVEFEPDDLEYDLDVERAILFPLGQHGVFAVATGEAMPFEDPDRSIAKVLATTVTAVLDRLDREESLRDREHRLRHLVEATHDLMAAGDAETTMEIASEAAAEVLDFPGTGIRRYDPDSGTLRSVSLGRTVENIDDRPPYPVEDSPHGRAFRAGETVVDRIEPDDPYDRDPFDETMYVPLGDHGVLSVGMIDGEIRETDRQLAELLAASTEAALDRGERRETLERHEDVLETVQGMVYATDGEGRFTLASEPLANRLGYDRGELVGTSVSTIFDEDAVETERRIVERLIDGEKESTAHVTEVIGADGDRVPVEVEISLLPGDQFRGTVGVVRDRTELERTRAQLERERDRFSRLFHNLPDPISDVEFEDGVPVIREVNAAYEETFGHDREELIGASPNEFMDTPQDAEFGLDVIDERIAMGELVTEELSRVTADGVRDFLFRGIPYRDEEEEAMAFGIYTDITEQKHLQRRLGVLNRVLRHNVRNNVTVVLGYAELLAEESGDDPYLSMAASELYDAAKQVARLGTQAREAEQLFREDDEGPVDLVEVIDRVVGKYRTEYPDADIGTHLPQKLPVRASERVELAIENLIDNAVEHNDDPTVRVTGDLDENWVRIRVADDGPGIPAHERAVIESDRRETQLDHGSGLGLWIVRWTVDAFGGTLEFEESELGGAAVELRFPRLADEGEVHDG